MLLQRERVGREMAALGPAQALLCLGAGVASVQENTGPNGSISDFKKRKVIFFLGCLVRKFPQPCCGSLIPGAYYITNICSANERHLKVLAKQSWESWGIGSGSAPATEIRANKEKTPTEVSIPRPKCLPPYQWLGVLGGEPPSHGAGGFILSAGLFTAPSVWHQKEELYQPGEILILSTPILDFQQLQPVLETLSGGLLGGLFQ